MYQIVHETWLTRLVATFGDSALTGITQAVYGSGLFQLLLFASVTLAMWSLAWGIHQRRISQKSVFWVMAFGLLYPVNSRPLGYTLVNSLSRAAAGVLDSTILQVVGNAASPSERTNLPPGAVLEMLVASASQKIESPETRALLYGFVVNCLPNALRTDGEKASFDDAFDFESRVATDPATGLSVLSFKDRVLDQRALRNDLSYGAFRPGRNCEQGLTDLRSALASDMAERPLSLTERVVGGDIDGGQEVTTETWFKNWEHQDSKLRGLASNLRMAHAANYEKSRLIAEHGWDLNDPAGNWWQATSTDASLRELLIAMDGSTELGYRMSDLKNLASNVTGSRWAFSLGASIKDLKERIELVPYHLAAVQLLLKMLCPLIILTLFMQTFRFFFMWSGAWLASCLMPSIISASRAIHNTILLSKLGIQNLAETDGAKALAYGVDLSVAKEFVGDFVPLAYALIEQELAVVSVLSGAVLVGSWLAGGGANGFVSWATTSIQGNFLGQALSRGGTAVTSVAARALPSLGRAAGGAAGVAGAAVTSIISGVRKVPSTSADVSKSFVRKT